MPLDRLLSREIVLCASTKEPGTEDADSWRPWDGLVDVAAVVGVGGSGEERRELGLSEEAASESPRAGLSGNFDGAGAWAEGWPSLRLGSSNGLIPDCGDSADTGDADIVLSNLLSLSSGSIGETRLGDLFSFPESLFEPDFFVFGTSWSLKPSPRPRVNELVSIVCGLGRSGLSWAPPTAGDAEDKGVLCPDVTRFCGLPFS